MKVGPEVSPVTFQPHTLGSEGADVIANGRASSKRTRALQSSRDWSQTWIEYDQAESK